MEMKELDDIVWKPRPGVDVSGLRTFGCGFGSEFVYCYSFPSLIEMAQLKQAESFRIKVGKADRDPIDRISYQLGWNKTATPEFAQALLVFQTEDCGRLERWLHRRLERAGDACGAEWFNSNPSQLISLYQKYLQEDAQEPPSTVKSKKRTAAAQVNVILQPNAKNSEKKPSSQRVVPPLTPIARKWNDINAAAEAGATPNELVQQFGLANAAWRVGKLVNRGDWEIDGAPPAPFPGNDAGGAAHRAYGRAVIAACGDKKIRVVKKFRSRRQ
jgi:hypothetical protein